MIDKKVVKDQDGGQGVEEKDEDADEGGAAAAGDWAGFGEQVGKRGRERGWSRMKLMRTSKGGARGNKVEQWWSCLEQVIT